MWPNHLAGVPVKARKGLGRQAHLAVAVFLLTAVSADCGQSRDYEVPSDLCGVKLAADVLNPLYPNGEELEVEISFADFKVNFVARLCSVDVDGRQVIWGTTSSFEPADVIGAENLPVSLDEATLVPGAYEAMVWPGVAIAEAPCEIPEIMEQLTVALRVEYPKDEEESERVLGELIQPFMEGALAMVPCGEFGPES